MFLSRLLVPLAPLHFELRHLHAATPDARILFSDFDPARQNSLAPEPDASYTIRHTAPVTTYRPPSFDAYTKARQASWNPSTQSAGLAWHEEVVLGPDVESRETLLLLAKMTNNAYLNPEDAGWYELGDNWTAVSSDASVLYAASLRAHLVVSLWLGATLRRWFSGTCVRYTR
jgi:lipase ATG15